jgi:MFS family permease
VRTYRQLFAVAEFRAVFIVQCLAVGGASIGNLALGTITYASTGSALLTSLAVFGGPLIRLVASWFLASASDLLRPRTAMTLVAAVTCAADALQALPDLPWGARFAVLALPWVAMSATGGSAMALVSDILPSDAFIFGRATMNIAVGVTQIAGYGLAGVLLAALTTTELFLFAAVLAGVAVVIVRRQIGNHPPRAAGSNAVARSHRINTALLRSRVLRPIFLALWVPNGLIVGCESLFVPFAGRGAGLLWATTAAGMLVGDIAIGRFIPAALRRRLVGPLRLLLALPYLLFLLHPGLLVASIAGFTASIGYSASLPLQERLISNTNPDTRGQVLGLNSAGLLGMQGIGATLAGALAQALGSGPTAASTAIGVMAIASALVTVTLTPGLRRSSPHLLLKKEST